jgi:hypothetical protein
MVRMTIAMLALVALAGCSGISAQTPQTISTHYDPIFSGPDDATAVAEAHCQEQGGLHALEAGWTTHTGVPSIDWLCVPAEFLVARWGPGSPPKTPPAVEEDEGS